MNTINLKPDPKQPTAPVASATAPQDLRERVAQINNCEWDNDGNPLYSQGQLIQFASEVLEERNPYFRMMNESLGRVQELTSRNAELEAEVNRLRGQLGDIKKWVERGIKIECEKLNDTVVGNHPHILDFCAQFRLQILP